MNEELDGLDGLDGSSRSTTGSMDMNGLSSTKLKRMELKGKTSQILSDYNDFLADLHGEEGIGAVGSQAAFMSSSSDQYYYDDDNGGDGEYRRDFRVGEYAGDDDGQQPLRSWSRQDTFNQHNDGLLAIPENDLFFSHNYDYDVDRRRYFKSFCRSRILLLVLLLIALVLLLVSLTNIGGGNSQRHGVDDSPVSAPRPSDQELYDAINLSMRPKWYNHSSGWSGGTFKNAVEFCSSVFRRPCPYTAYCPAGEHKHPLGGTKDGQELWSPVSSHEFVSIGLNQTCKFEKTAYSSLDKNTLAYVACCEKALDDFSDFDRPPSMEEDIDMKHAAASFQAEMKLVEARFRPKWYSSSDGWEASTPEEGVRFCKSRASEATLCGYEAYCPGGLDKLYKGVDVDIEEDGVEHWSPYSTIDGLAMSVSVGAGPCRKKAILDGEHNASASSYVLCCRDIDLKPEESNSLAHPTPPLPFPTAEDIFPIEDNDRPNHDTTTLTKKEQAVMDYMNPLWYTWDGGTHAEADEFCKRIPGRELCLPEAYCPNNSPEEGDWDAKPLFLKMDPIVGEQWAPLRVNANSWIQVGTVDGNPASTCETYELLKGRKQPLFGLDGSRPELKKFVLCCLKPKDAKDDGQYEKAKITIEPIGWFVRGAFKARTYDEAVEFCKNEDMNGQLCPYEQLCKDGPGSVLSPPSQGEQWTPVIGRKYLLIGQENGDGDQSRVCQTHQELYGRGPQFGNPAYDEITQNIMCCARWQGG